MPKATRELPSGLSQIAVAENRKHSPERISALMLRLSTRLCPQTDMAEIRRAAKCSSTMIQPATQKRRRAVARLR